MKIIDEKGKFLGIINFLDMTVLLIILLLIGFMFYSNFYGVTLKSIKVPKQDISVTFFISNIRDISVNAINEGDLFKNAETKNTLGKVIEKTVSNAQMATTDQNGNVIYADIPDRYDIKVTVKGSGTVSEENIMISNETIQIGESIILESKIIRTNGIIFGIEY